MNIKRICGMLSIFISSLLSVMLFSPLTPALAHDYVTSGLYWDASSVSYDDSAVDGTWRWEIYQAKNTWSTAGADFVFIQSTGSSDNNIYIGETYDPNHIAEVDPVNINYNTGVISELDMIFNENESFSVGGGGGTYDIQTVALHEFGHFLMLLHLGFLHGTYVMYSTYNGAKTDLEEGEDGGIIAIYGEA